MNDKDSRDKRSKEKVQEVLRKKMDNQERLSKVIFDYNPSVAERVIY